MAPNILEKQKKGFDKEYHITAMTKAFEIVERFEKVVNTINYQNNKDAQNSYKTYPQLLPEFILPEFIYLENRDATETFYDIVKFKRIRMQHGEFFSNVKEIAISNPILKEHIDKQLKKDVEYLSSKSQNELIYRIDRTLIQYKLFEETKKKKYLLLL